MNNNLILDPTYSDAYWQRHIMQLRLDRIQDALSDLDSITYSSKFYLSAFHAKAKIYQCLGLTKKAIINYSIVIKLAPGCVDAYVNRAFLFEICNEISLSNEDYRIVRRLDSNYEWAYLNHAKYSFKLQFWSDAAVAFKKLQWLNPENSDYYLYAGRAYASLLNYQQAFDVIFFKI